MDTYLGYSPRLSRTLCALFVRHVTHKLKERARCDAETEDRDLCWAVTQQHSDACNNLLVSSSSRLQERLAQVRATKEDALRSQRGASLA